MPNRRRVYVGCRLPADLVDAAWAAAAAKAGTLTDIVGEALATHLGMTYPSPTSCDVPGRSAASASALAFEVHVTSEPTHVEDPDRYVSGAEWVPAAQAIQLLSAHPLAFNGLPAAARVSEPPQAAARVWQLRRQPDGTDLVLHSSLLTSPDL